MNQIIDPRELNDLAALAARGGLGHGIALTDCVAEQPDQLMYLTGDPLILLRDLGPILLASCEGVVGWVNRDNVKFDSLAGTSSSSSPASPPSTTKPLNIRPKKANSTETNGSSTSIKSKEDGLPQTIVSSPSPPKHSTQLPDEGYVSKHKEGMDVEVKDKKEFTKPQLGLNIKGDENAWRESNQFALDSPQISPLGTSKSVVTKEVGEVEVLKQNNVNEVVEGVNGNRGSMLSMKSDASGGSSAFGGIGGFMMGDDDDLASEEGSTLDHTSHAVLPASPAFSNHQDTPKSITIATPQSITSKPHVNATFTSQSDTPKTPTSPLSPTSIKSHMTQDSAGSWDIYDSYARESMYMRRQSKRAGTLPQNVITPKDEITDPMPTNNISSALSDKREVLSNGRKRVEVESLLSLASTHSERSDDMNENRVARDRGVSGVWGVAGEEGGGRGGGKFNSVRASTASWDEEGKAFEAARLALAKIGKGKKWVEEDISPKLNNNVELPLISPSRSRMEIPEESQHGGVLEGQMSAQMEGLGSNTSTTSSANSQNTTETGESLHPRSNRSSEEVPPRPPRRRDTAIKLSGDSPAQEVKDDKDEQDKGNPETPRAVGRPQDGGIFTPGGKSFSARTIATHFKSRILGDKLTEKPSEKSSEVDALAKNEPVTPKAEPTKRASPRRLQIANPDNGDDQIEEDGEKEKISPRSSTKHSSDDGNEESDLSTEIETPDAPSTEGVVPEPGIVNYGQDEHEGKRTSEDDHSESENHRLSGEKEKRCIPENRSITSPTLSNTPTPTVNLRTPITGPPRRPSPMANNSYHGSSTPTINSVWTNTGKGSPASPHSIAATRQAVDSIKSTPEGKRPRNLTLVGKMDLDLSQSKGPVPITFLIDDPSKSPIIAQQSMGLGLPSSLNYNGRMSPNGIIGRPVSPLSGTALAPPFIEDSREALKNSTSPYDPAKAMSSPRPFPIRSTTNPIPAENVGNGMNGDEGNGGPKPGFFPRPRSRSFSAAVHKALSTIKSNPNLRIRTDISPPPPHPALPTSASNQSLLTAPPFRVNSPGMNRSPMSATSLAPPSQNQRFSAGRPAFSRQSSLPANSPSRPSIASPTVPAMPKTSSPISPISSLSPDIIGISQPNPSSQSLSSPVSTPRSSSFSFRGKSKASKTSLGPSSLPNSNGLGMGGRPLASPVSNKDYEDTVKADGLDFEIIQPKRNNSLLAPSVNSSRDGDYDENSLNGGGGDGLERKDTIVSSASSRSLKTLPDTDEWGYLRDKSPVPEIFGGRAGGAEQRALEQKWLGIIGTPLPSGSQPPKKVRKLAIEGGVPASLRGKVWAWFMASTNTARKPGLYQQLLDHDKGPLNGRIDSDVENAYPEHSIYSETSTGQTDLKQILRAYSHFATGGYRSEMSLIAGMLLIHCVAEDAFWLLAGLSNGVLRDYHVNTGGMGQRNGQNGHGAGKAIGMKVDAAVFMGVLQGSEPKLAKLFKDIGLHPISFLEAWYTRLFIKVLPWPTALRVIDAVVAEGPRFLLIASLTILTVSKERLFTMPKTYTDVLSYLRDLPHDALLLPDTFMKACENVKFKDDDLKRLRSGVEKEMGLSN